MARGITKADVAQARDTLLARGQHPSIDAVRVALGNTGSKTTISRYLQELEAEDTRRLEDESLISAELRTVVARLAAGLREEATAIVEAERRRHDEEQKTWTAQDEASAREITTLRASLEEAQRALQKTQAELAQTATAMQQANAENRRLSQQVSDFEVRVTELQAHRQSLEEKHQHAREALEHFRNSAKEQREREQQRHEHQVQLLQADMRRLNETAIVSQNTLTQLNRDNARLATEAENTARQLVQREAEVASLTNARDQLATSLAAAREAAIQQHEAQQQIMRERDQQLDVAREQLVEQRVAAERAIERADGLASVIDELKTRLTQLEASQKEQPPQK